MWSESQQVCGSWRTLVNSLYNDPKVTQLMNTRMGQYLSSHPSLALTLLVFSVMATVPVGLFLCFALVTITLNAVGFVFFEVFLLCVGGVTLLCVLSGLVLFSIVFSLVVNACYITTSNILNFYHTQRTASEWDIPVKARGSETSRLAHRKP
ncbi:promethin-like [Myripristis murdjan]|uniref:promethin-like n=1 Tax=Myripristis murdjan TaxID=586833 RepID=UPI001176097E|nr:promethin [Myripristis murdjan]XP_029914258.1 promethin [Myripristis murdjan]XP_029914259.1 promethin [Myripristis murdjan]XP_029914260.1 promethin [Myripristis murdjan]